jgi:hypothetical protein
MIALHNSRDPFSSEIALQGNHRKHPALADLAARQCAGFRFQAHRLRVCAKHRGGLHEVQRQVHEVHERPPSALQPATRRSATHGHVARVIAAPKPLISKHPGAMSRHESGMARPENSWHKKQAVPVTDGKTALTRGARLWVVACPSPLLFSFSFNDLEREKEKASRPGARNRLMAKPPRLVADRGQPVAALATGINDLRARAGQNHELAALRGVCRPEKCPLTPAPAVQSRPSRGHRALTRAGRSRPADQAKPV